MNALANAVNGLAGTLNRLAGYRGDYERYNGGSTYIRGVLVLRDYEVMDDEGIVTQVQSHDWLFRVEDIDQFMPPLPGDRWKVRDYSLIAEQDEDMELPYEAMTIGKRPCFEPHDAQGIMVVVHTKKVANA